MLTKVPKLIYEMKKTNLILTSFKVGIQGDLGPTG